MQHRHHEQRVYSVFKLTTHYCLHLRIDLVARSTDFFDQNPPSSKAKVHRLTRNHDLLKEETETDEQRYLHTVQTIAHRWHSPLSCRLRLTFV